MTVITLLLLTVGPDHTESERRSPGHRQFSDHHDRLSEKWIVGGLGAVSFLRRRRLLDACD